MPHRMGHRGGWRPQSAFVGGSRQELPDGICLDEGAIWVADPRLRETIRVKEGSEVTHRISTGEFGSYACMLGGTTGRRYISVQHPARTGAAEARKGQIEYCRGNTRCRTP